MKLFAGAQRVHNFSDSIANRCDGTHVSFDLHADRVDAVEYIVHFFTNVAGKFLHAFHESCNVVQRKTEERGKPQRAKREHHVENVFGIHIEKW